MVHLIIVLLMIVAIVCLGLEAFGIKVGRATYGWFGLACWATAVLVAELT